MQTLEQRAAAFARHAHAGQQRKYTMQPYIVHPAAVAAIVSSVNHAPSVIAAAWLHDVVEDCGVSVDAIEHRFGSEVAQLVLSLTDQAPMSLGNRAARKSWECRRIAGIAPCAKTVKLADLIDNTSSIVQHDPAFARVYLREKAALLDALVGGDDRLLARARDVLLSSQRLLDAPCS